eukprot:GEMP01003102.1.p1 GENE.GEMP01003102.1~~GEMP01003102.1.p1  ORF type:complete len:1309 (+),score=373.49 GEMP01003102.1:336-4262(+)
MRYIITTFVTVSALQSHAQLFLDVRSRAAEQDVISALRWRSVSVHEQTSAQSSTPTYACWHFAVGEASAVLKNSDGIVIATTMTINSQNQCEKLCTAYTTCLSYDWDDGALSTGGFGCALYAASSVSALTDHATRQWCQKLADAVVAPTEVVFECKGQTQGNATSEFVSTAGKKITEMATIKSEQLCGQVCRERDQCKSYNWRDTDKGACQLFTSSIAGGTHATSKFCAKQVVHRSVRNTLPFFVAPFPLNATAARSDANGEVGFRFVARHDLKITSLARVSTNARTGSSLNLTLKVTLWSAESQKTLSAADIGPQSPAKNGYVYANLATPISVQKGKEYRLTLACTKNMVDSWRDDAGTNVTAREKMSTELAQFLGGVRSTSVGAFPAEIDKPWQRAGMLNFEAEIMDSSTFVCQHFTTGDEAKPVVNAAGQKVAFMQPTHTEKLCRLACGEYDSCVAYNWQPKEDTKCQLFLTKDTRGDHASRVWCKKIQGGHIAAATTLDWKCQEKAESLETGTTNVLMSASNEPLTKIATIEAEKTCALTCMERTACKSYAFKSPACQLFTIAHPTTKNSTDVTARVCAKEEVPSVQPSNAPVSTFFTAPWASTRNDLAGEVGFAFTATSNVNVLSLGRRGGVTKEVAVTLWAASTGNALASVEIGPPKKGSSTVAKDGYVFATLRSPVELIKGKEYRLTQACAAAMADKWPDAVLSEHAVAPFVNTTVGHFIGAVFGATIGKFPAQTEDRWRRAGMLNFEAQRKEPAVFTCAHFMNGDSATELRNAAGKKLTAGSKSPASDAECEQMCREYAACHSYMWSKVADTDKCKLYSSAEPGGDERETTWCKKDVPGEYTDKFTFQCHNYMHGEASKFLATGNGTNITSFGTITTEALCAQVCRERVKCGSYDFQPISTNGIQCHLFASLNPGGTKTQRSWCTKVPVPKNAFGKPAPYFSSHINTYAAPTRNDATGEFGFVFKTRADLQVISLGRPINSTQTINVTLWSTSPPQLLASVPVGPTSVTTDDGYRYAILVPPVILTARKEYALSQQCTKGMADKWHDATLSGTIVASVAKVGSMAEFVGGAHSTRFGFPATRDDAWRRAGILNFKAEIVNATTIKNTRVQVAQAAIVAQFVLDLKKSIFTRKVALTANLIAMESQLAHLEIMINDTTVRLQHVAEVPGQLLKGEISDMDVTAMVNRTGITANILKTVDAIFHQAPNDTAAVQNLTSRVAVIEPHMGAAPDSGNISTALLNMNTTFQGNLEVFAKEAKQASNFESALKGNFSEYLFERVNAEIHKLLLQMNSAWATQVKND